MQIPKRFEKYGFEDILCLAVLISNEELPYDAAVEEAQIYQKELVDCGECPFVNGCLACIINE